MAVKIRFPWKRQIPWAKTCQFKMLPSLVAFALISKKLLTLKVNAGTFWFLPPRPWRTKTTVKDDYVISTSCDVINLFGGRQIKRFSTLPLHSKSNCHSFNGFKVLSGMGGGGGGAGFISLQYCSRVSMNSIINRKVLLSFATGTHFLTK